MTAIGGLDEEEMFLSGGSEEHNAGSLSSFSDELVPALAIASTDVVNGEADR